MNTATTTTPSTLNITIDGMSCGHCVANITNALKAVTGVVINRVTVGSASVAVSDPKAAIAAISAIQAAGYTVRASESAATTPRIGGCCGGKGRSSSCCG